MDHEKNEHTRNQPTSTDAIWVSLPSRCEKYMEIDFNKYREIYQQQRRNLANLDHCQWFNYHNKLVIHCIQLTQFYAFKSTNKPLSMQLWRLQCDQQKWKHNTQLRVSSFLCYEFSPMNSMRIRWQPVNKNINHPSFSTRNVHQKHLSIGAILCKPSESRNRQPQDASDFKESFYKTQAIPGSGNIAIAM